MYRVIRKRKNSLISSAMQPLKAAQAEEQASVALISAAQIWAIFSVIFSAIFSVEEKPAAVSTTVHAGRQCKSCHPSYFFEEAVFGCEKEIEINFKEECSKCHGTGAKPGTCSGNLSQV